MLPRGRGRRKGGHSLKLTAKAPGTVGTVGGGDAELDVQGKYQ